MAADVWSGISEFVSMSQHRNIDRHILITIASTIASVPKRPKNPISITCSEEGGVLREACYHLEPILWRHEAGNRIYSDKAFTFN
jgi:hypothetical protein